MKTTTFTTITDDALASIAGGKDPGGGDIGAEVGQLGRLLGDALAASGQCPAPPRASEPSRPGRATTGNVPI